MENKKIDVLGILSLIFGVLGILTICACGIGGIFGLAGLVLGIIGLANKKNTGKVFSIVGTVFSGIALVFGIGWLILYVIPRDKTNLIASDNFPQSFNTSDYIGKEYGEVKSELDELGFHEIKLVELEDLDSTQSLEDGKVESVSVGGNEKYRVDDLDELTKEAEVVITYHSIRKIETKIIVDFVGNIIFDKYDVNVYLDNDKIDSLKHGQDLDKTYLVKEGKHTLKFSKSGDSSVYGEVGLNVMYPTEVKYKISCYGDYVDVDTEYEYAEVPLEEGQIRLDRDEYDFRNKDYLEIEKYFKSVGFNNITLEPVYDIYFGITPKGTIDGIYINGFDEFRKGDVFFKDDEVRIVYHMPYEDNPDREITDYSGENSEEQIDVMDEDYNAKEATLSDFDIKKLHISIMDQPFIETRDMLLAKGFNLEYIHENTELDFTGELNSMSDTELQEYHWICRGIYDANPDTDTLVIIVNTTENIERLKAQEEAKKKLEEKFDPSVALSALEMYGKEQYPYGFRIHMIIGRLGEEVYDEDTWFMKYKAKYKDWTGQWIECTCEGKIKGPESNPQVYDFMVY